MNEDHAVKLYAGHMGICAVLVNVLIEKGVISQSELKARFQQAHQAASQCSGGPAIALVLEDILEYLERPLDSHTGASQERRRLFPV
jgi:hypothetical protein